MTTSIDRQATVTNSSAAVRVIPVTDGDRPVGAWVVGPESAAFHPVIDVTRLAGAVLAATGAIVIATVTVAATTRRRPEIGAVTMGPGGWVSVKRTARPALRSSTRRPWWARLLRAHRLVVQS